MTVISPPYDVVEQNLKYKCKILVWNNITYWKAESAIHLKLLVLSYVSIEFHQILGSVYGAADRVAASLQVQRLWSNAVVSAVCVRFAHSHCDHMIFSRCPSLLPHSKDLPLMCWWVVESGVGWSIGRNASRITRSLQMVFDGWCRLWDKGLVSVLNWIFLSFKFYFGTIYIWNILQRVLILVNLFTRLYIHKGQDATITAFRITKSLDIFDWEIT